MHSYVYPLSDNNSEPLQLKGIFCLTCRAHDNVQQLDDFCLNVAFVSTNITVNGHSVLTNSNTAVAVIILQHMFSTL